MGRQQEVMVSERGNTKYTIGERSGRNKAFQFAAKGRAKNATVSRACRVTRPPPPRNNRRNGLVTARGAAPLAAVRVLARKSNRHPGTPSLCHHVRRYAVARSRPTNSRVASQRTTGVTERPRRRHYCLKANEARIWCSRRSTSK